MEGASVRKIAVVLGISRNTVRRHVRRATHGSAFPPPLDAAPAWRARAGELVDMHGPIVATVLASTLRGVGYVVSARSVQRELARRRADARWRPIEREERRVS